MKAITLKLPDYLNERLTSTALERRTTKSAVAREALESFLGRRTRTKKQVSCLDLAGDIVGSVEGPEDLASNPKFMEGFGRSRRER